MTDLSLKDLESVNEALRKRIRRLQYWALLQPVREGLSDSVRQSWEMTEALMAEPRARTRDSHEALSKRLANAEELTAQELERQRTNLEGHSDRTAALEEILAKVAAR